MAEGPQDQIIQAAKHHPERFDRTSDSVSALGNISEIRTLEKMQSLGPKLSFILQEEQRSLSWQCARSDIGCLLDKASYVPDLKFHCVGSWGGCGAGSGFCLLGTGGVGAGGEDGGSGCGHGAGIGSSRPQTSTAPLSLRQRKLQ